MNDTTRDTTGSYNSNDQSVAVYIQDPRSFQASAQVQVPDQVGYELEQLPLALTLQKTSALCLVSHSSGQLCVEGSSSHGSAN